MDRIFEQMTSWLKDWMIDGLMSLLTGVFDSVNTQVGNVSCITLRRTIATSLSDFH